MTPRDPHDGSRRSILRPAWKRSLGSWFAIQVRSFADRRQALEWAGVKASEASWLGSSLEVALEDPDVNEGPVGRAGPEVLAAEAYVVGGLVL